MTDLAAAVWGREMHNAAPTLFKHVKPGEWFTFEPNAGPVMLRTARGYKYRGVCADGTWISGLREYRTGARVSCFLVRKEARQ